ncbi:MAG: PKD domain-containing protein, partial [Flavobacteriales bacterium]
MKRLVFFLLFFPYFSFAQFSFSFPDEVLVCEEGEETNIVGSPNISNLNVDFSVVSGSGSHTNLTDDVYSPLINIGFPFEFYGNTYTQCVASSNGYLSFNASNAGGYSPWSINSVIPTNAPHTYNAILGPYADVNPGISANSEVDYATYGVAPNRVFIVIWDEIAMFSCTDNCYYNSIMLFEGSNEIINTVGQLEECPTWNGGYAIQGIVNDNGTQSIITDDPITNVSRNFPNTWTSDGDAVKYTPNGSGGYTHEFIDYITIVEPEWYDPDGNLVAQGYNVNIPAPPVSTLPADYTVVLKVCDQEWEDEVTFKYGAAEEEFTIQGVKCAGETDGRVQYTASGGENEAWDIKLKNASGVVVASYTGDNMPVLFDNLPSGIYTVESVSETTCESATEIAVPVEFKPVAYHADIVDVQCFGAKDGVIDFYPHGGFDKDWSVEVRTSAGALIGNYNQSNSPITISNLDKGIYRITASSPSTCEIVQDYEIEEPEELVFATKDLVHKNCDEFTSYINFVPEGGQYPYSYYIDGDKRIDLEDNNMAVGTYELKVIDGNGCELIENIEIYDMYSPIVDFEMTANGNYLPITEINLKDATISFADLTTVNPQTEIDSWFWEFGDVKKSGSQNPTHTYTQTGIYEVYLFVTDKNGCTSSHSKTLNVISPVFMVPNIFTPNGDGSNEELGPKHSRISEEDYVFRVYDRWGRLVFETEDLNTS